MKVTTTYQLGGSVTEYDVKKIVVENDDPLGRQSLIERVNEILDQYETKDARPI